MERYDRSGVTIAAGKIGRVTCLRQEWVLPSERFRSNITGWIELGALRNRLLFDAKVDLVCTYTPARFIDTDFPDIIKDGPTGEVMPFSTVTNIGSGSDNDEVRCLGVGRLRESLDVIDCFSVNYNNVWHWMFRHPDDQYTSALDSNQLPNNGETQKYGRKAINLPSLPTRMREQQGTDAADYEFVTATSGANEKIDLRAFERQAATFRAEQRREWMSQDRYMEVMKDIWNTNVGHNHERRPYVIDHVEGWLSGFDLEATDQSGLGAQIGKSKMRISHRMNSRRFQEHGIVAWFLVVRFPFIHDQQGSPLLDPNELDPLHFVMEPGRVAVQDPEQYTQRRLFPDNQSAATLGWVPFGQHMRTGWNNVQVHRDAVSNTPVVPSLETGAAAYHYCADYDHAFQSLAFGHYTTSLRFGIESTSPVPRPESSIFVGG